MQILEICPPAANKSICKSGKGKHYKIADDVFRREYEGHSAASAVAAALGCSIDYVYRTARKLQLTSKCGHGGVRSRAGRPAGAKNDDQKKREAEWKVIEYKMIKQLEIDQIYNSHDVNIRPGRVAIRSKDYYRHAGSVYRNDKCLIRQPGLPRRLEPILAITK